MNFTIKERNSLNVGLKSTIFHFTLIAFLILNAKIAVAQPSIQKRFFQFSVTPALGTNGLQPGSFSNVISVNLTSGYSAASSFLELATISNLNTNYGSGVQLSGLANLIGANSFGGMSKKEKDIKIKNGFVSYFHGLQVSGVTNLVIDEVQGAQITGGVNLVKGLVIGIQFSGVSNIVSKYTFGIQAAGFFNVSKASINGVQIAGLSNFTEGGLYGLQLGLLNQSGETLGKNSPPHSERSGAQIGLVNYTKEMRGFQIGLINFAKTSQGTQIGLINIYRRGKLPETRDGTAIGLINIGGVEYISVYANEIFGLNYEIATGTRKNGRVKLDKSTVHIVNSLIYSHSSYRNEIWGMGYGLKKMFCNRSALPGQAESKFVGIGMDFQHINFSSREITKDLSLLFRVKIEVGRRITRKSFGFNWHGALTFNSYIGNQSNSFAPDFLKFSSQLGDTPVTFWLGYSLGIILH